MADKKSKMRKLPPGVSDKDKEDFISGAKTSKRQNVKTPKLQDSITLDQRHTVYLTSDTTDNLALALIKTRKILGRNVAKSLFIEKALGIILEELENKGDKSKVVKALKR